MDFSASEEITKEPAKMPLDYQLNNAYLQQWQQQRQDVFKFIPFTTLRTFPRQGFEWLYGWTDKAKSGIINVREDLLGEKRRETEIHESIHTPDEYETRRLTEWVMSSLPEEKNSYSTLPLKYRA